MLPSCDPFVCTSFNPQLCLCPQVRSAADNNSALMQQEGRGGAHTGCASGDELIASDDEDDMEVVLPHFFLSGCYLCDVSTVRTRHAPRQSQGA